MGNYTLITGATSGIGYEMADILADKGNNIILASRNEQKMIEVRETLQNKYSVKVDYIVIDLSKNSAAQTLFDEVKNKKNIVNTLINNSGFGVYGEAVDQDVSKINNMLRLNIIALTELSMLFGAEMKLQKKGYILNIASTAAYQPLPFMASYGASKSYVLHFSEALSKELEDYGVVVSCLSPGATDTGFFKVANAGNKGIFSRKMSARKVAKIGVSALYKKKLSIISGFINYLMANFARFGTRNMVASITKKMIK